MADKSSELERIYTIPLRRAKHGTRSKRANRAIRDVRDFLTRHMKSGQIWIAGEVNETLWSRGKFMIPSKIRVRATRFDDGVVEVTLPDSNAEGSVREAIQERQEKAAETPVLAPDMGMDGAEHDHDIDVADVDGIGPATKEKLSAEGIETVADLLEAGDARVAEIVGRDVEGVDQWFSHARMLAEGGHEHMHNDDDLVAAGAGIPAVDIDGIGPKMAEQLTAEGINTVGDFLAAGIDRVAEILGRQPDGVDQFFAHAQDLAHATLHDDSEE